MLDRVFIGIANGRMVYAPLQFVRTVDGHDYYTSDVGAVIHTAMGRIRLINRILEGNKGGTDEQEKAVSVV